MAQKARQHDERSDERGTAAPFAASGALDATAPRTGQDERGRARRPTVPAPCSTGQDGAQDGPGRPAVLAYIQLSTASIMRHNDS